MDAVSHVLEDDDMLGEILIRLIFPTSLVRAALVCRRWLRVVSDPAFLRRFRDLQPPRLLGFYVQSLAFCHPRFVKMPHLPTEFDALVRRAGSVPDIPIVRDILDCQNGHVLVEFNNTKLYAALSTLHPARASIILPPLPITEHEHPVMRLDTGGVAYTKVMESGQQPKRFIANFHELRAGTWHNLTSPAIELLSPSPPFLISRPVNSKLYLMCCTGAIASSPSLSTVSNLTVITLPDGVEDKFNTDRVKSWVDESSLYLVHVKELQLRIWTYMMDNRKWLLQDAICLCEAFAKSGLANLVSQDGLSNASAVKLHEIGHNANFALLQVGADVLCINIKSRIMEKVYSLAPEDRRSWTKLIPVVMIWPPIFPVAIEDI